MANHPLTKIIIFIFATVIIGFVGFIAAVMTSLFGGVQFYTPLVIVVSVFLIVLLFLLLFTSINRRFLKISTIVFASIVTVSVLSYSGYSAYIDSLKMVTDRGVDLHDYQPFTEGANVASLDDEASYKIKTDFPILDGATALYPVYSAFAQAVYPEDEYDPYDFKGTITSTKTDVAFERLISGEVDMIFTAGPSARQQSKATRHGVELDLTPIGREAFVFFVNFRNPIEELTIKEIQGIYAGKITNWSDVGGENESIRAFQRPPDSGSQTALENLMGDISLMEPPTGDIVGGMGGMITETSDYHNYRNAIGYSFRYFSTEMVQDGEIKHIKIEGIYPNKETIRNGQYPIAAEFYAVTAGSDNQHIDEFLNWILSDEGQQLVERSGYVPVN